MRQAGRHLPEYMRVRATTSSFIDFCLTPDKAAKVTLQPIERYDMDAAILFSDILVIPFGMGRRVDFIKGQGPDLDPISVKEISALKHDNVSDKIFNIYETVSRVRKSLSDDKALIGFCGGPWTVATYMLEGRGTPKKIEAKRFAYEHPEVMDDLLTKLALSSAEYLIAQVKAGADALQIFESWAEGLSPYQFETMVIKPTQIMLKALREFCPDIPIIGFPRGSGFNLVNYMKNIEINGIGAGTDMPLDYMRGLVPDHIAIQGNLDPLLMRLGGTALKEGVERVLKTAKGPHIFNLGHGIEPDVKIENVHAVINHIRGKQAHYV